MVSKSKYNTNLYRSKPFGFTISLKRRVLNETLVKKNCFINNKILLRKAKNCDQFYLLNRSLKIKINEKFSLIKNEFSWKSIRIKEGLPLNGQRTHSNANSAKRFLNKNIRKNKLLSNDIKKKKGRK